MRLFFKDSNATSIGMILQNASGGFVVARVVCFPGCWRVEEGEAMGTYEALSWIKQCGLLQVEFVSDCKTALNAIQSRVTVFLSYRL